MEPTNFENTNWTVDWTYIDEATSQDNTENLRRWWLRTSHVMDVPATDSASGLWLPDIETIFGTSTPDAEELEDKPTICDNQMSWEDMMQLQGEEDEK